MSIYKGEDLLERIKFLTLACILLFSVTVSAVDEPERIWVKRTETKNHYFITPVGVGVYSKSEDKDLLPGNDSFGFFYKSVDEKRGICRLRVKVVCDYGMEILKEQKNIEVKIQFADMAYKANTDLEGIMDIIFRCDVHRANDGVTILARKFMHSSKLSELPRELRISSDDCK